MVLFCHELGMKARLSQVRSAIKDAQARLRIKCRPRTRTVAEVYLDEWVK